MKQNCDGIPLVTHKATIMKKNLKKKQIGKGKNEKSHTLLVGMCVGSTTEENHTASLQNVTCNFYMTSQ